MAECLIKRRYNDGGVKIVSWQNGTPQEIAAMIAAADAGKINLGDYWSVGDERTVHLNAISANPNGAFVNAMDAQNVIHVLMHNGYMSQSGIHFLVGQKDCLNQKARINATSTSTGSWSSSKIRADLNSLYYNAISDSEYKALFKEFTVTTANSNTGSGIQTTTDKIALFAEKEIWGIRKQSVAAEANALSQISYYAKSDARKLKKQNGSNTDWWLRSPTYNYDDQFVVINTSPNSMSNGANAKRGVAPFMCI